MGAPISCAAANGRAPAHTKTGPHYISNICHTLKYGRLGRSVQSYLVDFNKKKCKHAYKIFVEDGFL